MRTDKHKKKDLEIYCFLKEARELGINSTILGNSESEDPNMLRVAGDAAEGYIISSSEPKEKTRKIAIFEKKYENEFGTLPDVLAANAYDSLMLQILSYEKCHGDSDCMIIELHKVKGYSGVSGMININQDGSTAKQNVFKIVKDKQFIAI